MPSDLAIGVVGRLDWPSEGSCTIGRGASGDGGGGVGGVRDSVKSYDEFDERRQNRTEERSIRSGQ